MDWRPLSTRAGQRTDVKFDSDGRIIVRSLQNETPILEHNKTLRNHVTPGKDWRHVASVPLAVVHKWLQEGIDIFSGEQQAELARKLNDPDNAYLRTSGGRLGVSNGVAR